MNTRKGLAYLLIGLLSLTTSCSDDDDSVGNVVDELIDEGEEIVDGTVDEGEGIIEDGEEIIDGAVDEGEGIIEDGEEIIDGAVDEGEEIVIDEETEVRSTVVISEVSFGDIDWVEIYNPTDEAVDVGDFWLCAGPGRYDQINTLVFTGMSGTEAGTVINGGEALIVSIGGNIEELSDAESVGLYIDDNGDQPSFGSSDFIIDFVQYGEGGTVREEVAVAAGLWTASEFVPVSEEGISTIAYSGTGIGATSWFESMETTLFEVN